MPQEKALTFHWSTCAEFLDAGLQARAWSVNRERGCFESSEHRLFPPLVAPLPLGCRSIAEYIESLPPELGRHCVILMQAGAVSIGLFEAGQALYTKSIRKYVVRGKGRAQPTHLKTKGKSRYGSRLRLQNAQLLLQESADRLLEWWREAGPIERVYLNAPGRMWADFLRLETPAALHERASIVRIPLDLPRPTTDVLLRTYRALEYGRLLSLG